MDPTLPYDFQSLWCSKHRDGLHYLPHWQLEELFAELDESLEEHASEEERRLLEGQKRMLLPALMQIEMEVARKRGVPQGQRTLSCDPRNDFRQELDAPPARPPLHCQAMLAGMLLQK